MNFQTIQYFLLLLLKKHRYTTVLLVLVSAFTAMVLTYADTIFSQSAFWLYHTIQKPDYTSPGVSLIRLKPGHTRVVSAEDVFSAVGCAVENNAASIIVLIDNPYDDPSHESSLVLEKLLQGESVPIDHIPSAGTKSRENLKRIITEDNHIHLALLTGKTKERTEISEIQIETDLPVNRHTSTIQAPAEDFLSIADSYVPARGSTSVSLTSTVNGTSYPHAALTAVVDNIRTVRNRWYGLILPQKNLVHGKEDILIPYHKKGQTYIHQHNSVFTKAAVQEISFKDAYSFYSLLENRDTHLSTLSLAAGNDVFEEIAAARRTFLFNSFPFVSKHEDNSFHDMYLEAQKDAKTIEDAIIIRIKDIIRSGEADFSTEEKLKGHLSAIEDIDTRLDRLKNIEGTVCIISAIPFYGTQTGPALRTAQFADSILSGSLFAEIPFFLSIILSAFLCSLLILIFLKHEGNKKRRSLLALLFVTIPAQFILFYLTSFYINPLLTQGTILLSWLLVIIENKLRQKYTGLVRLQSGINLPQSAVERIASSPYHYDFESRQNGFILETIIFNYRELESSLSHESFVSVIKKVYRTVTDTAEQFSGVETVFDEDRFRYCFLSMPDSDNPPLQNAVYFALQVESELKKIHALLHKKTGHSLLFCTSIISGTITSVLKETRDIKRIVYTGEINTVLRRLNSVNRTYRAGILITDDIYSALQDKFRLRILDRIRLTKTKYSATLFEILASDYPLEQLEQYNAARQQFYGRKFSDAKKEFRAILREHPEDGPARLYYKRCNYYIKNQEPLKRTIDFNF